MSEFSKRIRRDFSAGDMVRDAGLSSPADVKRYDDISYGPDEKYNLLDVYRPVDVSVPGTGDLKKLPVIAIVHGGAWVYGDKGVYQHYAMSLAQRGFSVVNFSYRLAPESKFPAQLEDICAVFKWMDENSDKYGLDTGNVFAVGDSAGAHLLGLFANLYSNPGYKKALKDKYPGANLSLPGNDRECNIRLSGVALNCGKYDLSEGNEEDRDTPKILPDFLSEGGSEEELLLTCVTRFVSGDFPPAFIMTCPGDFLRYQAPFMVKALMDKRVPFLYRFYGNADDPLHHVFHCNMGLESAKICNDDECDYFRKLIKGSGNGR